MTLGRHANPNQAPDELVYDPYAKIVVNVHQPVYAGVTPLVLEAHEVTSLKNNDAIRSQRIVKLNSQIDNVREYLIENYDELGDHADEIARLLDIELTNEVTIDLNVTFSVTMALPVGIGADSVEGHDFSFDLISENSDYEIQDYDTYVVYCNEC
ncbi:MAG: hypothetical protein EBR82_84390 [Caulobacteraceae bacterium]|nr:hypothetical protein [Caulobacteraceae bacterium]